MKYITRFALVFCLALVVSSISKSSLGVDERVRPLDAPIDRSGAGGPPVHSEAPQVHSMPAPASPGGSSHPGNPNAYPASRSSAPGQYPGYYDPNHYNYGPLGYRTRCEQFFNNLYFRYGALYPDLLPKVRASQELYLTNKSVKAALQESFNDVTALMAAFAELETLVQTSGSDPSTKKQAKGLSGKIKNLASKIKNDAFLNMLDLRKDTDVLKDLGKNRGHGSVTSDMEDLKQLIGQLHSELAAMYSSKNPGVISVKSYSNASSRSLAKGIEKLIKRIESHS